MVEKPARCFRYPMPYSGPRLNRDRGSVAGFVAVDQPERLFHGKDNLHRTHDDALEGIGAGGCQANLRRGLGRHGREKLTVEAVPGHRPHVVRPAPFPVGMEGVGPLHMSLGEMVRPFLNRDIETPVGHDPAAGHRILIGMVHRHELVVPFEVGEREPGDPAHQGHRGIQGLLERRNQRIQLRLRRQAKEPANAHVDGMNFPTTYHGDNLVSCLLQLQPGCDLLRKVLRHVDAARVPQEIGSMEHQNVEPVALDPFPAVNEPSQKMDVVRHLYAGTVFDRVDGTGLIGDRADATDPGSDVGRLGEAAAPQERLEEPGWLEDLELEVHHPVAVELEVHGTLTLNAGQIINGYFPLICHRHSPPRTRARPR